MVGETMASREKIMEWVSPAEINGQFDFPLYWDIRGVFAAGQDNLKRISKSLMESIQTYGSESLMSIFLGNHDFSRFMAYADNKFKPDSTNEQEYGWKNDVKVDNPENYKKIKLGFSFLMTIPGIPLIYYGDEFGMTGAHDPDNRRVMRFGNELTAYEKDVLQYVSKLTNLRNKYSVFRYGDVVSLIEENEYFVYALTDFTGKAVVIIPRNCEPSTIKIQLPAWLGIRKLNNAFTGESIKIENNAVMSDVTPYNAVIFVGN